MEYRSSESGPGTSRLAPFAVRGSNPRTKVRDLNESVSGYWRDFHRPVVEARTVEFQLFEVPTTPQVYFPAQINIPENAI